MAVGGRGGLRCELRGRRRPGVEGGAGGRGRVGDGPVHLREDQDARHWFAPEV